ncbi:MAG: dephospho-CoA kinase, partial [Rickettsiales bacterium]|nr:dephospho-CoA kinase [Rickettsiales bacterium]
EPLINRQKLGEIVFKNPNKKKLLESLVYPELSRQRQEIIKLLNRQNFRGVLVFEIPLLFENNLENQFDFVITIFCNKIIQKQRVLERKNMSEEKFNNILKTQMTLSERLKKSDTSYNSGSHQLFITSFAELLKIITSVVR